MKLKVKKWNARHEFVINEITNLKIQKIKIKIKNI